MPEVMSESEKEIGKLEAKLKEEQDHIKVLEKELVEEQKLKYRCIGFYRARFK